MERAYSMQFFSSFVDSVQKLCRDFLDFDQAVELSGYLSLEIDNSKKERYVLSELVQNSGNVISESYCIKSFKTVGHHLPGPCDRENITSRGNIFPMSTQTVQSSRDTADQCYSTGSEQVRGHVGPLRCSARRHSTNRSYSYSQMPDSLSPFESKKNPSCRNRQNSDPASRGQHHTVKSSQAKENWPTVTKSKQTNQHSSNILSESQSQTSFTQGSLVTSSPPSFTESHLSHSPNRGPHLTIDLTQSETSSMPVASNATESTDLGMSSWLSVATTAQSSISSRLPSQDLETSSMSHGGRMSPSVRQDNLWFHQQSPVRVTHDSSTNSQAEKFQQFPDHQRRESGEQIISKNINKSKNVNTDTVRLPIKEESADFPSSCMVITPGFEGDDEQTKSHVDGTDDQHQFVDGVQNFHTNSGTMDHLTNETVGITSVSDTINEEPSDSSDCTGNFVNPVWMPVKEESDVGTFMVVTPELGDIGCQSGQTYCIDNRKNFGSTSTDVLGTSRNILPHHDSSSFAISQNNAKTESQMPGHAKAFQITMKSGITGALISHVNEADVETSSEMLYTGAPLLNKRNISKTMHCRECNYATERQYNFKRHMLKHNRSERIKCDICEASFQDKHKLRRHLETTHEKITRACEECGKSFKTTEGLHLHVKLKHRNAGRYKCQLCPRTFHDRNTFNGHLSGHTQEKPEVCDICRKRFRYKCNLTKHKKYCKALGAGPAYMY